MFEPLTEVVPSIDGKWHCPVGNVLTADPQSSLRKEVICSLSHCAFNDSLAPLNSWVREGWQLSPFICSVRLSAEGMLFCSLPVTIYSNLSWPIPDWSHRGWKSMPGFILRSLDDVICPWNLSKPKYCCAWKSGAMLSLTKWFPLLQCIVNIFWLDWQIVLNKSSTNDSLCWHANTQGILKNDLRNSKESLPKESLPSTWLNTFLNFSLT